MRDILLAVLVPLIVALAMLDGQFDRDTDPILRAIPGVTIYEDATYVID